MWDKCWVVYTTCLNAKDYVRQNLQQDRTRVAVPYLALALSYVIMTVILQILLILASYLAST